MSEIKFFSSEELAVLDIGRIIPPEANIFHKELGGFLNEQRNLLGVVIQDKLDHDFSFVIQRKSRDGSWACVRAQASIESVAKAKTMAFEAMQEG